MSPSTQHTAGIMLILVPTIAYGGASLLRFLARRTAGYLDNPVRRGLFAAGHAHAGVLLILALVALPYLDAADVPPAADRIARICLVLPPVLMPAGFFLSVASPRAQRPNRLILLTYVGGVALAAGTVIVGVGLA